VFSVSPVRVSGTMKFGEATLQTNLDIIQKVIYRYTADCLEASGIKYGPSTCQDLAFDPPKFTDTTCWPSDGGCYCSTTIDVSANDTFDYSVQGSTLVSGPSSGTYCVQNDTLLVRTDTYGMMLQRAGCLGEAQSCSSATDVCPAGCADNSRCEATVFNQNCAKWTNFHDCALLDCHWVVSCVGTPAPCASLSQTACTAQPGCKWVEP
jgi:hypothetical protein